MAQYDGSIRIGTKIDTSGFEEGKRKLETDVKSATKSIDSSINKMENEFGKLDKSVWKTAQEITSLTLELNKMRDLQIPTQEYTSATKEVEKLEKALLDAYTRKEKFLETGGDKSSRTFKGIEYDIEKLERKLEIAEQDVKNLVDSGKAFTLGSDTEKFANISNQIDELTQKMRDEQQRQSQLQSNIEEKKLEKIRMEAAEEERILRIRDSAVVSNQKIIETVERIKQLEQEIADLKSAGISEGYSNYDKRIQELSALKQEVRDYNSNIGQVKENYKKLGNTAKNTFNSIGNILKKANSIVDSFAKKIKEVAKKHLPLFRKETDRAKGSVSGFGKRLKSLALSLLVFNQISKAFRSVSDGLKTGFENLYNENEAFKNSVENLKASLLTLKNALAGAFSPIVEIAIPYIQKLVEWLTAAVNLIGQFIAALTGRKTYTRAIKQSAAASKDAAEATEEETEAMNKQLSPLDKLNALTSEKAKKDKDKGGSDAGGGIMFEEVPIDGSILDMADKVKDILSKLFAPIKEAWDREGKFVMDSWKYALDEVWKLIKDIGRDFLTVWQQEATINIFADLLHILGDIGLIVGHLARNFRDAWNENQVGLHILENIRDIIGIIVHHIRLAADATVEWADKLDFYPLLDALERWLDSLKPVVDALMGILEDFYTMVLLPLGKWVLEKGLPDLLQVFIDFNDKVDWDALRERLAQFWEHLEPFAETIGEGLILFIDRVSDALADFINSPAFDNFLTMIENWMDSVTPEDVADALEMIAKALIGLKLALLGFSAISALAGVFGTIKSVLGFFASFGGVIIKGAGLVATGVGNIVASLGGILPALALVAGAVIGWKIGEWINEKFFGIDTPGFFEMMDGIKSSFTDGSWRGALDLWGEDIKSTWSEIWGWVKEDFNKSILGQIVGSFTDGTWRDAMALWGDDIYNAFVTLGERQSEWLASLKEKWSKTWNGIKEKITGTIGSIKSTVGSVIDWIKGKLDSLKESFNIGTGAAGGKLFGNRSRETSYSTRSLSSPYAANPALMAAASVPIPALARGAVIPPNREFLAVLGDQKSGTNIEAPLETIKQAQTEALMEVFSKLGMTGGGQQEINLNVTAECEGAVLFRIIEKYAEEYKKQHGGKIAFT